MEGGGRQVHAPEKGQPGLALGNYGQVDPHGPATANISNFSREKSKFRF